MEEQKKEKMYVVTIEESKWIDDLDSSNEDDYMKVTELRRAKVLRIFRSPDDMKKYIYNFYLSDYVNNSAIIYTNESKGGYCSVELNEDKKASVNCEYFTTVIRGYPVDVEETAENLSASDDVMKYDVGR